MNIKIVATLSFGEAAATAVTKIAPETRRELVDGVMEKVGELELDGIYLRWIWPDCPKVK